MGDSEVVIISVSLSVSVSEVGVCDSGSLCNFV